VRGQIIYLASTVFLFFSCSRECDKTNELQQIEMLKADLITAQMELESLSKSKDELDKFHYWMNDENIVIDDEIKAKIENDFRQRTDLIPTKGILGGTMYFSKITLISSNWLIAEFEDGHIMGRAIYRYDIDGQKFKFKLIDKQ